MFDLSRPAGVMDTVTLKIGSATGHACEITKLVGIPDKPVAAFTGPSGTCEGIPVTFTNQSTGDIIDVLWDFKDQSTLKKWDGIRTFSDPDPYSVTLYITDKYGCTDTAVHTIQVHGNPFISSGIAAVNAVDSVLCTGDTSILYFVPPAFTDTTDYTYIWPYNESTYASTHVTQSGHYILYVTDDNGCWAKYKSPDIRFQGPGRPVITGETVYCLGGTIDLTGNEGPAFLYQWLREDTIAPGTSTNPDYTYAATQAELYNHRVIVTDPATGCVDTSAPYPVTVEAPPDTPVVSSSLSPACGPAVQTLMATSSGAAYFRWNTGQQGSLVPAFGPAIYAVNAYSQHGCSTTGFFTLHSGPDFDALLSGCYTWCDTSFPRTHPPLPGQYDSYYWYRNGQVLSQGSGLMNPLSIPGAGTYYLVATTIDGCTDTSATLDVTEAECEEDTLITGCPLDITVDSILLLNDTIQGTEFYFRLGMYNPTGNTYAIMVSVNGGWITNVSPQYMVPGQNYLQGIVNRVAHNIFFCLEIQLVDTATGDFYQCEVCDSLVGWGGGSEPCGYDALDLELDCVGVDTSGEGVFSFSISGGSVTGASTLFLQATGGSILQYTPHITGTGSFGLSGYLLGHPGDSVCIELLVVDSKGGVCVQEVCDVLPACYDTLDACDSSGISAKWHTSLVCDSIDGLGNAYVHWGIDLTGVPGGYDYPAVVPNGGTVTNIVPRPLPSGSSTLYGAGLSIPNTTVPYCLTIYLVDTVHASACRIVLCDTLPCIKKKKRSDVPGGPEGNKAGDRLQLLAFPNPTADRLTIQWAVPAAGTHHLVMTDLNGRMVFRTLVEGKTGSMEADTRRLAAGLYYLRL
ncbi:MAG TPA: PKD domain-containing protein, partial [Pseudodesulfovibrio sp.]|nr:PKD domain-containing protein [Pseudodesulfovibrio sp.]